MNLLYILIPALVAMLLSRILIPLIILVTYKKRLFDPIDLRKQHHKIVPRLGGVAFAPIQCCVLVVTLVAIIKILQIDLNMQSWAILPYIMMLLCGLVILFIVGIGDDLIGIDYKWKFMVQLVVASFLPLSGLWVNNFYGVAFIEEVSPWIGIPFTMFVVVLVINAVNLIDGLDGLCSGVVAVGCAVLGCSFIFYGAWLHALFAFITVGVLIPFFFINVFGMTNRRRQIFMGDTGSMTLGYSIAFLAISFAMDNTYIKPASEGAIVLAFSTLIVPVFDVARVIYIRWKRRKPLFKPDRNHLHHFLLEKGLRHRSAMIAILSLTLFFCVFNMLAIKLINLNIIIIADILLWCLFIKSFIVKQKRTLAEPKIVKSELPANGKILKKIY
ncbi:undecaprenyl-phosphate alpha-N-acetylglucosaminyl 1-phosphate transferase [Sphingobacterium sp. CZ-UAM]|uniref:MraY family glycosyltransferase n=1 Tax=Sphingobacterium sp. CZ-UAM TaxID=1933868 RepID=UPI000987BE8C|nr:MraY family glycosyltransferase [Sphingobacterium sp. CZ-UAM]OOG20369.1 undecaprenyl-phosphate alpha-N-acetylglucosaminyl 1-phosphate transferase [Sphingobacterium sp. CZ-UAM]